MPQALSQLVAAVLSLSGNLLFFSLLFLGWIYRETPELQRLFHYLSFQAHFSSEYIGGVVELRYIVFYLGFTSLFLFLRVRSRRVSVSESLNDEVSVSQSLNDDVFCISEFE